ncbi:MAG: M24 family metallopeptidase [Alphaproteobacteria bacterium]|nr:M24 family metallopeptidase [Alphaproteobacteria bacterium]
MTERFCNLDRLLHLMDSRGVDAVLAASPNNVYWLSGFNGPAHKSDEPRPLAVLLAREAPEEPVMVLPDFYLGSLAAQPGWIEDIRPFRAILLPFDQPPRGKADLDRFVDPQDRPNWFPAAADRYAPDMVAALERAVADLGLAGKRVAADEPRLAARLANVDVEDGYGLLMSARSIKTPGEVGLMRAATAVNRAAIEQSIGAWTPGMTWRELRAAYHAAALARGGFVHDPGAMVLANGSDSPVPVITSEAGDYELEAGMRIMFDCHGTKDRYCWDGGKTWIVGSEGADAARPLAQATADAMAEIEALMVPGARISALQAAGRAVYRKHGLPLAEDSLIFFHGLGLSHLDQEVDAEGAVTGDFAVQAGMAIATHIYYPGDRRERMWLEDIAVVGNAGPAESIFGWDFLPHGLDG